MELRFESHWPDYSGLDVVRGGAKLPRSDLQSGRARPGASPTFAVGGLLGP